MSEPTIPVCKKALWCFWLGLFCTLCFGGILFGLPTVIFGHMALGEINRSPEPLAGKGLAITGLVLGYIAIFLSVVMLAVFVYMRIQGIPIVSPGSGGAS